MVLEDLKAAMRYSRNDILSGYDSLLKSLEKTPNSLALQHQAILALARAGSLEYALAEYHRYGLDKVGLNQDAKLLEDIMGLGARLLKDLHLSTSGEIAKSYALESSQKYEAAYKATSGFYSGINSATMGLIADLPEVMIQDRARDILLHLPSLTELNRETLYFVEATRAEAYLLLGEAYKARKILRTAIQHDPQNYIAHASTLRQFKMILDKQGDTKAWLSSFEPPQPAHYAGHIFAGGSQNGMNTLSDASQGKLKIEISDAIQTQDIGFGYGSLAAGSDILIAEVLMDEGCELNAILPVPPEVFISKSVEPFGADWVKRFQICWDAATSQTVVTQSSAWPNKRVDRFSGTVAMGMAISQAVHFSVEPLQLLVWDDKAGTKGTSQNAIDWVVNNRKQIVIPYAGLRQSVDDVFKDSENVIQCAIICRSDSDKVLEFSSILRAVDYILKSQEENKGWTSFGFDIMVGSPDEISPEKARRLAAQAVPGGILVSETVMSLLSLNYSDKITTHYMGTLDDVEEGIRAFAAKPKT